MGVERRGEKRRKRFALLDLVGMDAPVYTDTVTDESVERDAAVL